MIKSMLAVGLLLLFLLPGCSKSHSPKPGLVGRWQLDDAVSVNPGTVVDYARSVLELRSDSTYAQTSSWGNVGSGSYSTANSNIGIASYSLLYLKPAGSSDVFRYEMQLIDLKLTLTGEYAIEHFHKL
ncbi:MAG TPA: hypothetical protein VGM31_12660 [Puia sp.]|jgi:hypothetical protein